MADVHPTVVTQQPEESAGHKESHRTLHRGLGLYDSTMIVAGSMIGSGIFIVAGEMAREVGSAGWLMVAWLIAGLLTFGYPLFQFCTFSSLQSYL